MKKTFRKSNHLNSTRQYWSKSGCFNCLRKM